MPEFDVVVVISRPADQRRHRNQANISILRMSNGHRPSYSSNALLIHSGRDFKKKTKTNRVDIYTDVSFTVYRKLQFRTLVRFYPLENALSHGHKNEACAFDVWGHTA